LKSALGLAIAALLVIPAQKPLAADAKGPGQACVSISDPAERLACFDAAYARPAQAGPAPTRADAAATVAGDEALARKGVSEFGMSEAARRAQDPGKADLRDPSRLEGRVARVGARPRGEMILTLDNGQVWVQTETDSRARVKEGDSVTIRKAALGSYMLITENGVATRVRRVE
jgi:hypothetical protein